MYYIFLEGHNYSYEVYEMVTLYFPEEKITTCNSEEDIPKDCRLIRSTINIREGTVYGNCVLLEVNSGVSSILSSSSSNTLLGEDMKKAVKHSVKLSLYNMFKSFTGIEMPWGILVGIRPTKIVNDFKQKGADTLEISNVLQKNYLLREDKIKLVTEVSDNSYNYINHDSSNVSIYIGIPFCPTRCVYCSFAAYPIEGYKKYVDSYISSLKYEIDELSKLLSKKFNIDTIYIGGGTPTSLDDRSFYDLITHISSKFDIKRINEFTVEAGRPDTITDRKLEIMSEGGVNRISINPQSMNDSTLKRIGRQHTVEDIIKKYELACKFGFKSINMDMIIGLPGEDESDIKRTVEHILDLNPENITIHSMAVKRASRLKEEIISGKSAVSPSNIMFDNVMDYAYTRLHSESYKPYYMYRQKMSVGNLENVGYCIEGHECLYNIQMIEEKETTIGLGVDSVTKLVFHNENRIERLANKKDIAEYISSIKESTQRKVESLEMLT